MNGDAAGSLRQTGAQRGLARRSLSDAGLKDVAEPDVLDEVRGRVGGFYIIPPFGRYEIAVELVKLIKGDIPGKRSVNEPG